MSIEDGERLQDKRAENIASRNDNKGSSRKYNERRGTGNAGFYKSRDRSSDDSGENKLAPTKDPRGNFKGKNMIYKKLAILFVSILGIVLTFFVFMGGSIDTKIIVTLAYLILTAFLVAATFTTLFMGIVNLIKKRPYFYHWTNVFLWASIVFFILFLVIFISEIILKTVVEQLL